MGIQLSHYDRLMIASIAKLRRDSMNPNMYLFGYLSSLVDQFLAGTITKRQLAEGQAQVELLRMLDTRCSPEQLLEIVAGTREVPGDDVQSG